MSTELDLNAPEVQEAIKEQLRVEAEKLKQRYDSEYSGLRKNKDEILAEKKQLQEELQKFKSQYEGIDIEQIRKLQVAAEKDARLKILSSGDPEQISAFLEEETNKRTEMMRRDAQAREVALQKQVEEYQSNLRRLEEEKKLFYIDTKVREAASKYVQPEMTDYMLRLGRETFTYEEDGTLTIRSKDGTLKMGRDGITPMTPEEWVLMQKDEKPYIFLQSAGAGAQKGGSGKGGVKFKEDLGNPAEKARYIQQHGLDAFLNLASRK